MHVWREVCYIIVASKDHTLESGILKKKLHFENGNLKTMQHRGNS